MSAMFVNDPDAPAPASPSPEPSPSPSPEFVMSPPFEMEVPDGRIVVLPGDETQISVERSYGLPSWQMSLTLTKLREFIALLALVMDWLDADMPEDGPEYDAWKAKRDAQGVAGCRDGE